MNRKVGNVLVLEMMKPRQQGSNYIILKAIYFKAINQIKGTQAI